MSQLGMDPGIAHEKAAIMKLYADQARYTPLPQVGPDYMKRLMNNQVSQLDMKPGAKFNDLYSNKINNTLDDKISQSNSMYNLPTKSNQSYKLRPLDSGNLYQSPGTSLYDKNNLESHVIGYQ